MVTRSVENDTPVSIANHQHHASRLFPAKERSRVDLRPDTQTSLRRHKTFLCSGASDALILPDPASTRFDPSTGLWARFFIG